MVLHIIFLALAAISLGLRLLSRRMLGTKLWWDDYVIVIAFLLTTCVTVIGLLNALIAGWGQHFLTIEYYEIIKFGKVNCPRA